MRRPLKRQLIRVGNESQRSLYPQVVVLQDPLDDVVSYVVFETHSNGRALNGELTSWYSTHSTKAWKISLCPQEAPTRSLEGGTPLGVQEIVAGNLYRRRRGQCRNIIDWGKGSHVHCPPDYYNAAIRAAASTRPKPK